MGIIFDIQRFCVHDGPGIRTTVFFKGCNLRCKWCHNPESIKPEKQLSFKKLLCSLCGECAKVCTENAHQFSDNTHKVDFSRCRSSACRSADDCSKCVQVCMTAALSIIGYEITAEEIVKTVIKDAKYYTDSGGGLTVSGGEATIQFEFLCELLTLAKKQNIHVCLETNGIIKSERLTELIPLADLFLVDYKHWDRNLLKKYTGADLDVLMNTLSVLNSHNKQVILRCPIIPGINDNQDHYDAVEKVVKMHKNILSYEYMNYHDIWKDKLEQISGNQTSDIL